MTALAVLCGLIFLVWTLRHVTLTRSGREAEALTPAAAGPPEEAPPVSALVAAKDEAANIGACVASILAQDYPNLQVTVIDDRSTDGTAAVVERIAAGDDRLRLIRVEDLPAGWSGKNHAMQRGADAASGEWLFMTDADCRLLSPRALAVAVQYALERELDLLSVMPRLEMRGFWENVVQPVCSAVMVYWHQPGRVNAADTATAYANGAFMLLRREAYDALGQHRAVKDALMEDLHFARLIKRSGRRLRVVQAGGLVQVRMYTSLGGIVRGWSRIFYGTFESKRRLAASAAVLAVMSLLPYATAIVGFGFGALAAAVAGSAAAAMQLSVIARFYRLAGARPWLAWTYPLGCVVALVILIKALWKHCGAGVKVVWRGTAYNSAGGGADGA